MSTSPPSALTYQDVLRWMGEGDTVTRELIETILRDEQEHVDNLLDAGVEQPPAGGRMRPGPPSAPQVGNN